MKKHYTLKICNFCILLMLLIFCAPLSLSAQNTVSGRVTDEKNEPVVGATVIVKNTSVGTITGNDGEFTIQAPANATLDVQFMGFLPKAEPVNGRSQVNVVLLVNETTLDDVVVVGYGTQRRGSITGAVSGVRGSEMTKTKTENPQNMLTGRVAGVRVWQRSAEPGAYSANFDVRGFGSPLVIIDGVPRDMSDYQRLNPADIEDISVLKDAAAAIYGARSGNGVLLITTKKGSAGKTQVNYTGSFTFQLPSGLPKLTDVYDAMTLMNEKGRNISNPTNTTYDDAFFESYRNGTRRSADWNSLIIADWSPMTQHDLSITGGSEKTQYYIGLGYYYQDSFFKSGDLNYNKFNLRSNISTEILKGLTFDLNLSGMVDKQHNPYTSSADLIKNWWAQGVMYPAYADPEETLLNYAGLDLEKNTVAMMTSDISGYKIYNKKQFQSSASLNYDFGSITPALKGLSAKAMFSFDYRMHDNDIFRKEYYQYSYNESTDEYTQKLYDDSSPSRSKREFFSKQQTLGQFMLNYDRTFNHKHKVGALVGWEIQKKKGDNFWAQSDLAFAMPYLFASDGTTLGGMSDGNNDFYEYAYNALIGRVNYSFDDRYIVEAQFRYDGSSKLAPGYQWDFFPSASIGWRLSEEPFFKNASGLSFINQLKFRASYGVLGNDEGDLLFDWLQGYEYSAKQSGGNGWYNGYAPGFMFDGKFGYGAPPMAISNIAVTWSMSKTFNVGVDFEAWNGMLGVTFDYFDRRRTGMLERAAGDLPTVVGATAPRENVNSERHLGLELELSHRHRVGDFAYKIKAIGTVVRKMHLVAVNKGPWGNSYDQWKNDNLNNRYQGVQFGLEGAGRYTSWEDIWTYPIYKDNDMLPGDYKYVDWNGDGEISGLDHHPFAYDQTPWLNYSLGFDASYKNFDLSLLFQGSALGSMKYTEPLYNIWSTVGGGTLENFLDRWHPVDPNADPYDPETEWETGYYNYMGRTRADENSDFNRVSTAYLRLKSIELGYTIPKIKSAPSLSLRIFANAYNVFTITKVKFVDPEHPDSDYGRMYPLSRTFTLGLSLGF